MKCANCKYLGTHLYHLDGVWGSNCWHNCNYPLPFYAKQGTVQVDIERDCKVYEKEQADVADPVKNCNEICSRCGNNHFDFECPLNLQGSQS